MIDVNCRAVVEHCHFFAKSMVQRKGGGLILFSSLVSFQGTVYSATYSATKAFIQNFAEALHFELKPKGIHVLSVAPGPVRTGFAKRAHMKMDFTATPGEVAKSTLQALGKQVTVLPGFLSKFLGYPMLLLSRWARIRVMKIFMVKMVQK
jgi:short-subunit dehydrogenase